MIVRYEWERCVWYLVIFLSTAFLTYGILHYVYGDDSELCMKNCNAQQLEDMHQALEIWNAANCSVRDICTPVNCTCIAPQIQKCDPDDEALNITGMCDPDWNDTN